MLPDFTRFSRQEFSLYPLLDNAYQEVKQAETAVTNNKAEKAILHYIAAYKALSTLIDQNPKLDSIKMNSSLADILFELYKFNSSDAQQILGFNIRKRSIDLNFLMFTKTFSAKFKTRLGELGHYEVDNTDYSIDENYLNRPADELFNYSMKLNKYDILENDEGELLIKIDNNALGTHENPLLFCAGKHALLFKGPYRLIICDFLHPHIEEILPNIKEVLFYETDTETEYMARVINHPSALPLAEEIIKLYD